MKIYITKFSSYSPSQDNPGELPKLSYVDSLFRRRLSQLTRMTIEVLHNLIGEEENCPLKLVFASFRGEIARQLKINKGLVEDADVMPAPFSLSVFNTPAAAATIALKMKAGYTVIYPSQNDFSSALIAAASGILSGSEEKLIFSYGDEFIPEEYKDCANYTEEEPLALACILSSQKTEGALELSLDRESLSKIAATPKAFISWLKKSGSAL
ncbi:MAG: beta-ketoacyl synthase chain length factor [Treponema sp.]|nr:beta-ketoacyl synthase chain length factor [Treponema sp.]